MTNPDRLAVLLVCMTCLLIPLGCSAPGTNSTGEIALNMEAPEIIGVDLDGREFKLSDYRGKVVMLSFWADW